MDMILYTEKGLQRLSRLFERYESNPSTLSFVDLGVAKDYATYKEARWLDSAWRVADYLGTDLPPIHAVTEGMYRRWRNAYDKWISGTAHPPDMPDVLNYCVVQANLWANELEIIDTLVEVKVAMVS